MNRERLAASSRRTNKEVITVDKTMKCQFLVFSRWAEPRPRVHKYKNYTADQPGP